MQLRHAERLRGMSASIHVTYAQWPNSRLGHGTVITASCCHVSDLVGDTPGEMVRMLLHAYVIAESRAPLLSYLLNKSSTNTSFDFIST